MARNSVVHNWLGRIVGGRPWSGSALGRLDAPCPPWLWPSQQRSAQSRTLAASTATPLATATAAPFSTTAAAHKRHRVTRDSNRIRGMSPVRRTGLREPVSVSGVPLPQPSAVLPEVAVSKDHGLHAFFRKSGQLMNTPVEDSEHGRAWTVDELRRKGWDDLHRLWWVCCRERNLIATADAERERAKLGFGEDESWARDVEVKKTMKAIRHTLMERYYLWEDAVKLAKDDPEIKFNDDGQPVFVPMEEQELLEEGDILELEQGIPEPELSALAGTQAGERRGYT